MATERVEVGEGTDLHGEVGVTVVVCEDVANTLVDHGEESAECAQSRVVHHMIQ